MKSKPLIKTHWVASQNPMTVSLAGLQSVVFNIPTQVLNAQFVMDPKNSAVALPSLSQVRILPPDEDEIRDVKIRSHTLSRDLYWTLFSGHDLPSLRMPPAALRELAQSVEFHFDDGQCLSLIGISRKSKFPFFLDPKFYLQDPSCNWERALTSKAHDFMKPLKISEVFKKNEDYQKAWFVILEILAWSFQRKRQVGDLDVLCAVTMPSGERVGSAMEDLEFLKARPLLATVMSEPNFTNAARMTVWEGVDDHLPSGILRLHSEVGLGEIENQYPQLAEPAAAELELLKTVNLGDSAAVAFRWQRRFMAQEAEVPEIPRLLKKIEQIVGSEHLFFVGHAIVSGTDFKPALKIREEDGSLQMAVSFGIPALGLRHQNFPRSLAPVLAPFWGGLDVFFGLERKEVASRQAHHRVNDLSFLRHQGVTLFCLLELINWKLKRPLSSGEIIDFVDDLHLPEADRQFQKVVDYLKTTIPGLMGKPEMTFDSMLSSEVKNLFLDFIEKLFLSLEHDRTFIFHAGRVAEIKNVHQQTLSLFRFLILHFMESTRGKFLTKVQSTVNDTLKEAFRRWTDPRIQTEEGEPYWVDIGLYNKYIITLLFELQDQGVDIELNGVPFLVQDNPFEFSFKVGDAEQTEAANWFDLDPQVFFNGQRISSEEVKFNFTPEKIGFIEFRGQIYRIDKNQIPTLKSLQNFWNRIKNDPQAEKKNSFGDKVYRLEKSQTLELLMLKAQGIQVQAFGEWKRIFDYFERGLGSEKIELPLAMRERLLPHQKEGAQWLHDLYELRLGAILADEMGLGKTFQILAFLVSLQLRQKLKKCLVVVPTSLVYNWLDEKKKFAPDLPMRIFQSSQIKEIKEQLQKDEPLVIVATYGLLNENTEFFQSQDWNVLAFDEAQNLKNIMSLRSVSARKLKAEFKICLTGTPMENHYLEFYSLCDLVVPGCLGEADVFKRRYYSNEVRTEALIELRLISKPLLLRRTKSQVKLSLPAKTVQKISLPFGEKQKEIYKKMAMTFSRQVDDLIQVQGEKKAHIAMFAALMRLRQICSDPAAVPGVVYDEQPVKVEHFLTSLQEHLENEESVIVFTQFLSTLGRLERELKKMKVPTFTLQGNVSSKERLRLISAFQESKEPGVMLMTLKTGGVGLNLTKASVVYHLEPWWNPAVENQATDRAHRMGQTKDVKVFNLLIEGSLEERIADLKLKKQGSFERLFGVDEQVDESSFEGSSSLTRDDFMYLLKS